MRPEWLSRSLIDSHYCITLCTSRRMFEAEKKKLSLKPERAETARFANAGGARCVYFETTDYVEAVNRRPAAIVCIDGAEMLANSTGIQIAALLCHEATHIWQAHADEIGEESPSHEFEAYSIQAIAQRLMYEFARQMGLNK